MIRSLAMTRTVPSILAVLAIGAAGCAQLLGLDPTSGDGRTKTSVVYDRVSIGATVITNPEDVTGLPAQFLLVDRDDPTQFITVDAIGEGDTWQGEVFEPAPLRLRVPGETFDRIIDLGAQATAVSRFVLERPGAVAAEPTAMINLTLNFNPIYANEQLVWLSVGAWGVRALTPAPLNAATFAHPPFATSTISTITGRPIERITIEDVVVIERINGQTLTGFATIDPFDQTDNVSVIANLNPTTLDQMPTFAVDPAALAARMATIVPAVPAPTQSWAIRAAPGKAIGFDAGPQLTAGTIAVVDRMVAPIYGSPFGAQGWEPVLTHAASATRAVTPPGQTLPITLSAVALELIDPATAGGALDFPVGIPQLVSVDMRPLSNDAVMIARPTKIVNVSFFADRDQNALYEIELAELGLNPMGNPDRLVKLVATRREPTFQLPPELFEPNKSYSLRAVVYQGLPNVAGGDLRTRTLPFAISFVDSGMFTVMP